MPRQTFSHMWDQMLGEGVVSFTAADLAARTGTTMNSSYVALHQAMDAKLVFSPAKGLYVLVPAEYRTWGTVPADWFIDDMMRHLGRAYYVSFLTAAARHGASHQASQLTQVVCDRYLRSRDLHGLRLRFYLDQATATRATGHMTGPTGQIRVATPETCALDLAAHPKAGGGIGVLLEVLGELRLDVQALRHEAARRPRAVVRRCGWLLEQTHPEMDLKPLQTLIDSDDWRTTPLVPDGEEGGRHDRRWQVRVNTFASTGA